MTPAPGIPIDPAWFVRPDGRDASRTIHGVAHATRVHIHALELAATLGLAPWEREALHYAAMWHDIGRTHDGVDCYHGAKSAGKATGLSLHAGVDPVVLETALFAVTHHCGDEGHAERAAARSDDSEATLRVFRVLKDADALDRVRLGRGDLEPSFLRHQASWDRIGRAWELLAQVE
jgi:HD superfamily phosphodiesterase